MADAIALRVGANNAGADKRELFLKKWSGEVLTAYEEINVTAGRFHERNITSGKSAQFPATWKVNASYHTPGQEILGQASNVGERVILVDDLLIAPVFIPNIDEAMNEYEYRAIYSTECGRALSYQRDKNILQVGVLAARASATVTGAYGGAELVNANFKTVAADLAAGMFSAAQTFAEKDVPDMERWAFLRPAQYYLLAQSTNVINKDWGGEGSYAKGEVKMIADIPLLKTNHLPITNIVSGPAAYQGDFSTTAALVAHKAAVGTVQLMGLATEMDYQVNRQGTLIVSKYALGHGILRPECSVELKTS